MSTLAEIEAATAKLPEEEKQALLAFLISQLRNEEGEFPAFRESSPEQILAWDAADTAKFDHSRET